MAEKYEGRPEIVWTPAPWGADRGFRDGTMNGEHTTIADNHLTILCGEEALDSFDPERHGWLEVHGAGQAGNAALAEAAPGLFDVLVQFMTVHRTQAVRDGRTVPANALGCACPLCDDTRAALYGIAKRAKDLGG